MYKSIVGPFSYLLKFLGKLIFRHIFYIWKVEFCMQMSKMNPPSAQVFGTKENKKGAKSNIQNSNF